MLHDQRSWYYGFEGYIQQSPGYKILYDKQGGTKGGGRVLPRAPDNASSVEFIWQSHLKLHLEAVVLAMHCESTLEQRAVFAQLFPNAVLDGGILQLFEGATESDPLRCVAIKWIVCTTPARNLVSYRDFLYFEYCASVVDVLGRRVLLEYKKSIDVGEAEHFVDHQLDVLRASMSMFNTYHTKDDEVVNTMLGTATMGGNVPVWATIKYLPTMFGRVKNTESLAHSMALVRAGLRASSLVPRIPGTSTSCHVCSRRFGLTQRKSWCRVCGLTVCRRCTKKLALPKEGLQIASHLPFIAKRFCIYCLTLAWRKSVGLTAQHSAYPLWSVRLSALCSDSRRPDSFFGFSSDDSDDLDAMLDGTGVDMEALFDGLALEDAQLDSPRLTAPCTE